MARAKVSPRPRAASAASRRSGYGRRRLSSRPDWVNRYLLQWHNLGIGVLLISILLLPWRNIILALGSLRDSAVQSLGYGLFLVILAMAALGFLLLLGRLAVSRRALRWIFGLFCGAICAWGILGLLHPSAQLAGIALHDVSAGGRFGRWLVGGIPGVAVWLLAWLGFSLTFWPRHTLDAFRAIPPGLVRLWRMDLHTRAWHLFSSVSSGLGSRDSELLAEEPFLPPTGTSGLTEEYAPDEPEALETAPRAVADEHPRSNRPAQQAVPQRSSPWQLPSLSLLATPDAERSASDNAARAKLIVDTLASFGVDAQVVQINQGPTVTQFGVEPGWEIKTRTVPEKDLRGKAILDKDGNPKFRTEEVSRTRVRVNQITGLANDLALALAAPSIRIEAPVPGKPVVGIEVPNTSAAVVSMRSVIETSAFQKVSNRSKLAIALGKGVSGEAVAADLARMPHLLIAGATGAGKSVCINSIIACILTHATPDEVRFVMIDPKRVELAAFGSIPHLALSKVIVDVDEVVSTLAAVLREMEARYKRFENLGVRNLEAYNHHPKVTARMPSWVIIIDELADLMMAAPYEVERQICRLAQLARATGIHLVVATQRPSVDVVTGLIKANLPTRIAFAVSSQVDSRTILDGVGAEKLLGRGDMLYLSTDSGKPRRLQGVFVSDQEIDRLVNFWTSEKWEPYRPPVYDHLVEEAKADQERDEQSDDPMLDRAIELAQGHSRVSASMLQRRLRIGYPRAARLMDELEEAGIVGPAEGGQSREVLAGELDGAE
jgi:DNA segregation ATPase FtsK/SpoIIIE, S-DNA-T family